MYAVADIKNGPALGNHIQFSEQEVAVPVPSSTNENDMTEVSSRERDSNTQSQTVSVQILPFERSVQPRMRTWSGSSASSYRRLSDPD